MLTAKTTFETQHASKYLAQLCKHFGHKVRVEYDAVDGRADLSRGPAIMRANDHALIVQVSAVDAIGLGASQITIESHLKRFAFREAPVALNWTNNDD